MNVELALWFAILMEKGDFKLAQRGMTHLTS